ncbi:MAG: DUF3634 family protein [Limisphaerales bacterium]
MVGIHWLGLIPPLNANLLIRIQNGTLEVERGTVRSHAREHLTQIVRDSGIQSGFIAEAGGRIKFSRNIPPSLHQRIRNVLLNQWA